MTRGGCVCIPSEDEIFNDLAGAINRYRATWLFLTPTVAKVLRPHQIPSLKKLTLAGEPILQHHLDPWEGSSIGVQIAYGPAESSIHCTWRAVSSTDPALANLEPSNIGRAMASWLWVVDPSDHNQLMPVGAIGELIIEGPLVGRGYVGKEKANEEAFIRAPTWAYNHPPGSRFYKTGDLMRYNPDGSLSFVCRKGRQVKFHGQKVDLGHLENHLLTKMSNLTYVAVEMVDRGEEAKGKMLAVFLSLTNEDTGSQEHDRSHPLIARISDTVSSAMKSADQILASLLPTHMFALAYFPLKRMPMTVSGKLDRSKLQPLVRDVSELDMRLYTLSEKPKTPPKTRMEKRLRRLWAEALEIAAAAVGADDNFFRLGGDSVIAMRLVAIAAEDDIPLTVELLFQNPCLSDLAAELSAPAPKEEDKLPMSTSSKPFTLLRGVDDVEKIKLDAANQCSTTPNAIQNIYPCTPLQEGLFAMSTRHVGTYTSQSVFKLPSAVAVDLDKFKTAWDLVVQTTEILRTRIVQIEGHGFLQVVLDQPALWQSETGLDAYLDLDKQQPIALGQPLSRFAIVAMSTNDTYFIWTAHHAAYDGWSIDLMMRKLQQAYETGHAIQSPLFCNFVDYVTNVDRGEASKFWKSIIGDIRAPTFPQLPSGRYQPHVSSSLTRRVGLATISHLEITPSSLLYAAWGVVVATFTGDDDVIFGMTMNGRTIPVAGISEMIGPTLTTIPFPVRVSRDVTILSFLQSVQKQASAISQYQHVGLQELKEALPGGSVNFENLLVVQPRNEQSQTSLNMETIETPGLDFHTYPCVVECTLGESSIDVQMRYDSAVLSQEQANNVLDHFEHMIQKLQAANNDRLMSDMCTLSPTSFQRVLDLNVNVPRESNACVHHLVEEHSRVRPKAPAVSGPDGDLTYYELDQVSNPCIL